MHWISRTLRIVAGSCFCLTAYVIYAVLVVTDYQDNKIVKPFISAKDRYYSASEFIFRYQWNNFGCRIQYNTADICIKLYGKGDFELPIIFVGGVPRSGTTLMRAMLDAHPDIRCGPETHVIPALMLKRKQWLKSEQDVQYFQDAGVLPNALDLAMAGFMLEIIKHHGSPSNYYCNKDPFVLADMKYVKGLFPNSKFIYMIRDGRATAHSIVTRKVTISRLNNKSYRSVLRMWNNVSRSMYDQCNDIGLRSCLPIKYEHLVLRPSQTTKKIFKFLDIPWRNEVLQHNKYLNGTKLSRYERSTSQVVKPLYHDALYSWHGHLPYNVEEKLESIAPMLSVLGYDPRDRKPYYGYAEDSELALV